MATRSNATQKETTHILSLQLHQGSLEGDDKFQLNRGRLCSLGLLIVTTLESKRCIGFACNALDGRSKKVDLLRALRTGLIELTECGKNEVLDFQPAKAERLCSIDIPPKASAQHYQVCAGLETDTTSEAWKNVLRPGHSYELRLSRNRGETWAYYRDEHEELQEGITLSKKLAIAREDGSIRFTVYDDPALPNLFAKLKMPQECHLSGHPPFEFVIEYSSNSDQPITVCKSQSPLSVFTFDLHSISQLINCNDTKTGENVEWSAVFGCFDSDPHPNLPDDADFVEILPGKPWRFEFIVPKVDEGGIGSLEELDVGKTYQARIASNALEGFPRWHFGRKIDLLNNDLTTRKKKWGIDVKKQGRLSVQSTNEAVEFRTVD